MGIWNMRFLSLTTTLLILISGLGGVTATASQSYSQLVENSNFQIPGRQNTDGLLAKNSRKIKRHHKRSQVSLTEKTDRYLLSIEFNPSEAAGVTSVSGTNDLGIEFNFQIANQVTVGPILFFVFNEETSYGSGLSINYYPDAIFAGLQYFLFASQYPTINDSLIKVYSGGLAYKWKFDRFLIGLGAGIYKSTIILESGTEFDSTNINLHSRIGIAL